MKYTKPSVEIYALRNKSVLMISNADAHTQLTAYLNDKHKSINIKELKK